MASEIDVAIAGPHPCSAEIKGMTTSVLTGGRRRVRAAHPVHVAVALSVATLAVLLCAFVLWIAVSLGANAIGDWMVVPIALVLGLATRRRLQRRE